MSEWWRGACSPPSSEWWRCTSTAPAAPCLTARSGEERLWCTPLRPLLLDCKHEARVDKHGGQAGLATFHAAVSAAGEASTTAGAPTATSAANHTAAGMHEEWTTTHSTTARTSGVVCSEATALSR